MARDREWDDVKGERETWGEREVIGVGRCLRWQSGWSLSGSVSGRSLSGSVSGRSLSGLICGTLCRSGSGTLSYWISGWGLGRFLSR